MITQPILCGACSHPLPPAIATYFQGGDCPSCGTHVEMKVFPAIAQKNVGARPETLGADTEASCFYHAQNRAVSHCAGCGRFLCSLCELETSGRMLCPSCFDSNLRGRKVPQLETSRTLHDSIALALTIYPALMFWPIVITAPLALYWTVHHWKSPRSVLPRTRIRFYLAALFAVGEIAVVISVVVFLIVVSRVQHE